MISEEEFESGVTPEVLPSKDLAIIIKETGLEPQLAQEFTINFEEHFRMAAEWAKKAKKIIVTDPSQTVVMQEARQARLFLREKRLEIEKFRVSRKEYFLKGGRAIDRVANFLKDTITPIEDHLDRQEHFVELQKKAEDARILAEAYAKQEAEIKAKEEADRLALAKAQAENARLMKEAAENEKQKQAELDKIRKESEARLAEERTRLKKIEDELKEKRKAEEKAEADRIKAEESLKKADDATKLKKLMADIKAIQIPTELKSKSSVWAIEQVNKALSQALLILNNNIMEDEV